MDGYIANNFVIYSSTLVMWFWSSILPPQCATWSVYIALEKKRCTEKKYKALDKKKDLVFFRVEWSHLMRLSLLLHYRKTIAVYLFSLQRYNRMHFCFWFKLLFISFECFLSIRCCFVVVVEPNESHLHANILFCDII